MKVRLFLIAALLMGTIAHMAAQDKKEFTLEVYGGRFPMSSQLLMKSIS